MFRARKVISGLLILVMIVISIVQTGIKVNAQEGEEDTPVAYYAFDGDLNDSSENSLDGTAIGEVSYIDGVTGKAVILNCGEEGIDAGAYIEVSHSNKLNLTEGYTISAWVYLEDIRPDGEQALISKRESSISEECSSYALYFHDNRLQMSGWLPDYIEPTAIESKKFVDIKRWAMVTVTSDGEYIRGYIDGKLIDNVPFKAQFPASTGKLNIGFDTIYGHPTYFRGAIDELKIYNYPRDAKAIKADYDKIIKNSDVVKMPSQLVAYYKFDADLKDYSGFGNNAAAVNTGAGLAYADGILDKALKFKSNSYIEIKDSNVFDFEKGFTISAWIYNGSSSSKDNQPIIQKLGPSFSYPNEYSAFEVNEFRFYPSFESFEAYDDASPMADNCVAKAPSGVWHMLTVTSNGSSVKFYIDNVLKDTKNVKKLIPNSSGSLMVGYDAFASEEKDKFFQGMMDELKIYNYELQYNDVKALYEIKDGISMKPADAKINLTSLKVNQQVKLNVVSQSYKYAAPDETAAKTKSLVPVVKNTVDVTEKTTYKSSNTKIAKVASNGVITIVGKGTATITATYGKYTAKQSITAK